MKNKDLFRLEHIRDSISKIEYVAKKLHSFDNFEKQWIEQDSIIRNLEITGEASARLSDDIKQRYPNVAWLEIRGLRNFVTHQYFGVELNDIWNTVINDIPVLKAQILQIIKELE